MGSQIVAGKAAAAIERLMQLHPKGFDLSLDRIRGLLENSAIRISNYRL